MDVDYATLVTSEKHKGPESKDCPALIIKSTVKSIDIEKRQIRVLASTADIDRDGERFTPDAFKESLPVYMTNPVVLAGHLHQLSSGESPVVGRTVKAWVDKVGLWAVIEFAYTPLAEDYWELYRDGFMKAVSVGFIPISWRHETENSERVRVCYEAELLEISLVAVPSNRQALTRSKQRKADFVAAKKVEREEEKILNQLREENPNFDSDCEEYASCLLGVGTDEDETANKRSFTEIVSGKSSKYVQIVQARRRRA